MSEYSIRFFNPKLNPYQLTLINGVLQSDHISTDGPRVRELREKMEAKFNCGVMLTSSGTTALAYALHMRSDSVYIQLENRFCVSILEAIKIAGKKYIGSGKKGLNNLQFTKDLSIIYNGGWDYPSIPFLNYTAVLDLCQFPFWILPNSPPFTTDFFVTSFRPTKTLRGLGGGMILERGAQGLLCTEDDDASLFLQSFGMTEIQAAAALGINWDMEEERYWTALEKSKRYDALLNGVGKGGSMWYEIPYIDYLAGYLAAKRIETSEFYPRYMKKPDHIALPVDITWKQVDQVCEEIDSYLGGKSWGEVISQNIK